MSSSEEKKEVGAGGGGGGIRRKDTLVLVHLLDVYVHLSILRFPRDYFPSCFLAVETTGSTSVPLVPCAPKYCPRAGYETSGCSDYEIHSIP